MILIISKEHGLLLKRTECLNCGVLSRKNVGDFVVKFTKLQREELLDWNSSSNECSRFRKDCAFVLLDHSISSILTVDMLKSVDQSNIFYNQLKRLLFLPEANQMLAIQPVLNAPSSIGIDCFLIFSNNWGFNSPYRSSTSTCSPNIGCSCSSFYFTRKSSWRIPVTSRRD